ncbi:hypothetical protein [Halobaculum magnesiiphilum]|uniref:Uncharacterized protein n=1 Tax=Halobaculum magnesiiphilum TaxID=1017351 RepID=A0A8T8WB53_9EURY|nr:hypothetical protein [Halobaculum magnesiiphilum]QZP37068.1 hypothetical protein K6T50_12320 [Halobaculum magnesiiphilum]
MSQSGSQPQRQPLGSRENFFAFEAGEYERDDQEPQGHTVKAGVNREGWIAKSILFRHPNADVLCPHCFHEFEAIAELSDPEDYVDRSRIVVDERYLGAPTDAEPDEGEQLDLSALADGGYSLLRELATEERYADHRRHRYCPDCGLISFGGLLADLPTDQFREVVGHVLDAVGHVPDGRRQDLRSDAMDRKRGGLSDVANVETLVRDLNSTDS